MQIGIKKVSESGVAIAITIIVVIASIKQKTTSLIETGRIVSSELMSLLNRFIRIPIGTDSKKFMLDLKIDLRRFE